MSLQLPSDPRFDRWRTSGWNQTENRPITHQLVGGTTPFYDLAGGVQRWFLTGGCVQGQVDAFGYPKSTILFPKSVYGATGKKGSGGGLYGYSWADAWMRWVNCIGRDFVVEFEENPTPNHHSARGFNPFDVQNTLLVNVHGINTDNFIITRGFHSEVRDATLKFLDNDANGLERTGTCAHYGFKTTGDDCAFIRCKVLNGRLYHEFSVEQADRTVFLDCAAADGVMDAHANKTWCQDTLHLRTHLGKRSRNPFTSGGNPIYLLQGYQHVNSTYVDCRSTASYLDITKPPAMGPGTTMWRTG